jgi:protein O-GlcNAc transferase
MFIHRFVRMIPKNGLKKALGFFNRGQYKKACKEFEACISADGDSFGSQDQEMVRMYMIEAYIEYSKILSSEGDYDDAAKQLERAIAIQPAYADVQYSLGCLYQKLGRREDSIFRFEAALGINPKYFRARVMLAKTFLDSGQVDQAVEELKTCLSSAPSFYIDQVKKLIANVENGSSIDEKDNIFHDLLAERPSSAQVCKQIALEAIQNGDHEYAMSELKKSISMNPNYPDLHNLLGIAYANMGLVDDALLEFETALKIHPEYLKALLNMALTLYEKSSHDEAMVYLERVLKIDSENELARNLLKELQPVS